MDSESQNLSTTIPSTIRHRCFLTTDVIMAKEKKHIDLKELTADELSVRLVEAKEKLFHLKFGHKTTPLKNPLEIRSLRRQIARMLTVIKGKGVRG